MSDEYNPFERVNHSTNFEDLAIGTSDETNFFDRHQQSVNKITSFANNNTDATKRDQLSNTFSKIYLKPHKFEPTIKFSIGGDAGRDSGTSSAEVTPATTPQSSPYTLRKMLDINKLGSSNVANAVNTATTSSQDNSQKKVSGNQKRWFYTGFFGPDTDPKAQVSSGLPKSPSFKNLMVSNFDINAVGPTSW